MTNIKKQPETHIQLAKLQLQFSYQEDPTHPCLWAQAAFPMKYQINHVAWRFDAERLELVKKLKSK